MLGAITWRLALGCRTSARVQSSFGVATLTFRQHPCHIQLHARLDSHSGLAGTGRSASRKRFLLANGASAADKKVASELCYLAVTFLLANYASNFFASKRH